MCFEHGAECGVLLTGWVQPVFEGFSHGLAPLLLFNVLLDCCCGDMTGAANIVASTPPRRKAALQAGELFAQHAGRIALELVGKVLRRIGWGSGNKQVDVIGTAFIIGSRARTTRPADQWSDLDLVVTADQPERYLSDSATRSRAARNPPRRWRACAPCKRAAVRR
jgi:hypothetical protein